MKRILILFFLISVLISGTAFADTAYVNGMTADRVHLRSMPDRESASLGLFYTGTPVEILSSSKNSQWAEIQIGNVKGYMMLDYLQREWMPSYMF